MGYTLLFSLEYISCFIINSLLVHQLFLLPDSDYDGLRHYSIIQLYALLNDIILPTLIALLPLCIVDIFV